jgi:1-acyl-sn-glycerol-3-phosphate acyltransferase
MISPLDERRAEAVAATARVLAPVARRVFRYEMRGLARVPPSPCLLVGNHSGAGAVEIPCMLVEWYREFGETRPGYGLTNVLSLKNPLFAPWLRTIGAIPASHENARAVLSAGKDCLVFPGGDIDSFRPFYEPRKVVFGKRRGYVRLALDLDVPIVPLATIGSHMTYWMAPGNAWIARRLGLKKSGARLESVPVTMGAIGAVLATGAAIASIVDPLVALAFVGAAILPFPARVTTEVLPAIRLSRELPAGLSLEERVERGHEIVFSRLQRAVRAMTHDAPLERAAIEDAAPQPRAAAATTRATAPKEGAAS